MWANVGCDVKLAQDPRRKVTSISLDVDPYPYMRSWSRRFPWVKKAAKSTWGSRKGSQRSLTIRLLYINRLRRNSCRWWWGCCKSSLPWKRCWESGGDDGLRGWIPFRLWNGKKVVNQKRKNMILQKKHHRLIHLFQLLHQSQTHRPGPFPGPAPGHDLEATAKQRRTELNRGLV